MIKREHGLKVRYDSLQERMVDWSGDKTLFIEFVHRVIDHMPDAIQDAMRRYYVDGTGQRKDEYGRSVKEDSMFYQYLQDGRAIMETLLRIAKDEPTIFEIAKEQ